MGWAGGRPSGRETAMGCPGGFPCKIHSRFELCKNRLLLTFTCDGVSFFFFNDVFAAVLSKRIIYKYPAFKKTHLDIDGFKIENSKLYKMLKFPWNNNFFKSKSKNIAE